MKQFFLLAATLAVAVAAPHPEGKIVGGVLTDISKVPYQISLQMYDGFHFCGGTIISPKYIVTASHCTNGKTADILSIRAGSSQYASGGQFRKVKSIIQHPKYNEKSQDSDIAILVLESDLTFDANVQPAKLPALNQEIPIKQKGLVSGWGLAKEENTAATDDLYSVELSTLNRQDCQGYLTPFFWLTQNMFCTLEPRKDSCQGDSGGPFVMNGQLIGIVSWGVGCARPTSPGIFASVPVLRNFITEHTGL